MFPVIIAIVVFGLVAAGLFAAWKAEQARTRALLRWPTNSTSPSRRRRMRATTSDSRDSLFRKGRSRVASNTIRGELEIAGRAVRLRMGDFRYEVDRGSGKNHRTETVRLSYLIAWNPFGSCPEVVVRREGFFDRVAGVLGFDDIDFESVEFSKAFHVSSDDKRFAYDLVDPRMMEFLLESGPPAIELDGGLICLSTGRGRWEPSEFRARIAWLGSFLERWPRHLADSMSPAPSGEGDRAEGGFSWFS